MITSAGDRTQQPTKFDVLDSLIKAREVEADRLRAQIQALQKENPDLAKGFQRQLDVLMEEQARVIAGA